MANKNKVILSVLIGAILLPRGLWAGPDGRDAPGTGNRTTMRPHLLITARKVKGLGSVEELRRNVKTGHALTLWKELKKRADEDLAREPICMKGGDWLYREYNKTAARVLRHALAFVITGDEAYKDKALEQIEATFDATKWPEHWREGNQPGNLPFGLRAGQFCAAFGLAYDWLYTALTPEERSRVVAGLDKQAIQPYLQAVENGNWQVNVLDNFCSTINGGVGIAAMAMGDDHPDFEKLMFETKERMMAYKDYLSMVGPEGEWPESVYYSNSYLAIVQYFSALRYWSTIHEGKSDENILGAHPIPQFCRWLMYMTLPDGRVAQLGNCGRLQTRIALSYVPAVAAGTRDGVRQWYYLNNLFSREATRLARKYPLELVWYDPTLKPETPEGRLPHGRAFAGATMCASSRANWDPTAPPCLVYGKAGAAYEVHGHHDVGQVCIHGYGDPLIVDARGYHLGGRAPEKDSYVYYVASSHNVLTFDGKDMIEDRPISRACYKQPERRDSPALRAKLVASSFDDERGGYWIWDTSDVYEGVKKVLRTVVHLNPCVVVVLDKTALPKPCDVSLRWHTATESKPDSEGGFLVRGIKEGAKLAARVVRIDKGRLATSRGESKEIDSYVDVAQSHKAGQYVEVSLHGPKCEILSLFCVFSPETPPERWEGSNGSWFIQTPKGLVDVKISSMELSVTYRNSQRGWRIER